MGRPVGLAVESANSAHLVFPASDSMRCANVISEDPSLTLLFARDHGVGRATCQQGGAQSRKVPVNRILLQVIILLVKGRFHLQLLKYNYTHTLCYLLYI
jgi:hypothetical protein